MAPYSAIADVQRAAGGREKLIQLSDNDSTGQVDVAVVDAAIAEADSFINSYFQHRFAVPVDPADVTEIIRRMSAREAVYLMKEDRQGLTDFDQERHEERRLWLVGVMDGTVSPGLDPRPNKSTSTVPATGNREDLDFSLTRTKLEGFV